MKKIQMIPIHFTPAVPHSSALVKRDRFDPV